jgi:hypothetical protein
MFDGTEATARYWFDMHRNGDDRRTRLLVALGPDRRGRWRHPGVSFVVHGRLAPGGLAFSLADAADAPVVPERRVTGRTLNRRRALKHPGLPALWQVVDTVIERDPALASFLGETHP